MEYKHQSTNQLTSKDEAEQVCISSFSVSQSQQHRNSSTEMNAPLKVSLLLVSPFDEANLFVKKDAHHVKVQCKKTI